MDELAERRRLKIESRDAALQRLGLHPPSLVCEHDLRHLGDRCPVHDEIVVVEPGLRVIDRAARLS